MLARCGFLDSDSDSISTIFFFGLSAKATVKSRLNLIFLAPMRLKRSLGLFNLVWYPHFGYLFHIHGTLGTCSNESSFDMLD